VRDLRKKKGVGLKRMAPEIEVEYTYLSKIENGYVLPSADVLNRIARYLDYDKDELMILADRMPADIRDILRDNPREALEFLRERFGKRGSGR
jgi:transcriptional regulator with XRE-family HTH domain